mmetsp:Transcript_31478/g.65800  ORF Transcript_31478/g.65800 Transcript_31478/m.65800 type:complete len:169 (+) Transcript_31478:207-713(+)
MVSVNKKSRKSLQNAALMLLEPSEINTKRYPAMASTSLDCVEARIGVGGSAGFSKAGSTIGRSSVRNAACSAEADPRQGADDTVEVVGGLTEAGIDFGRSNGFAQAGSIIGRSSISSVVLVCVIDCCVAIDCYVDLPISILDEYAVRMASMGQSRGMFSGGRSLPRRR